MHLPPRPPLPDHKTNPGRSATRTRQRREGTQLSLPTAAPAQRANEDLVIDALNRGEPYADWLLIFDNATNAEMVARYIPQGAGHVIITSRDSHWRRALRVDGIEVAEFAPTETVEFLRKRVPALAVVNASPDASDRDKQKIRAENEQRLRDASELGTALANLPLAAEHAAAYLAETGTSVQEYLKLFHSNAHRLLATDVDISYSRAVATTWSVSRETISPEAAALFKLLAFFSPEPIYEEVLLHPGRVPSPILPLPGALERVLTDTTQFRRTARELARFSLIKINAVRNVIQVHRVVQAVTYGQLMREDPEAAAELRNTAHALLAASDPQAPDRDDSEEMYERSRQHLVPSGALESGSDLVRRLIVNQVRRLHRRGGDAESLSLGEPTLEIWRKKFGVDDRRTLSLAVEIGFALRRIGRVDEAVRLNADTLERLRSQFGEEDQIYLTCARSYGLDLSMLGRYSEALTNDLPLLPLYERVFGPEHLDALLMRNNIAISLRCLGRFAEALEYDLRTLAENERMLGDIDTNTLRSRFAVARDLRRLGRYEEALDMIRAVNASLEHKGAPWDRFRLLAAADLVVSLRRTGYYAEAAENGEMVYRRSVSILGEKNRESIRAATTLVNDRRLVDNLAGAQDLGEKTVADWEENAGRVHPNTLAARANLAIVLRQRGNPSAARKLNEEALAGFTNVFGESHPSSITVTANLASDLAMIGEIHRARELGEHAFRLSCELRGPKHPSTLGIAANLSVDRRADGDAAGARQIHEETMSLYRKSLGPEHPDARLAAQFGRVNPDIEPMTT